MDENVCINCDYNKMWGGNCEYEQEEKCIYATARYLTHNERNKIEKCGKLHFKAVDRSIKFDWINSYNDYKRKFGIISVM